jgi:hypothetical protein
MMGLLAVSVERQLGVALGQEGVLTEAKMKVFQAIHTVLPIQLQVIL